MRWRLASSFPSALDVLFGTADGIARRVGRLTEGRFQIHASPAGEVVPALQVLDAVRAGTVECGHASSYYCVGKDPAFAFFTALPFGLNARQMAAWLRHGGGNELAAELFGDYGVVGFSAGDTGAQMGGWFRNEIRGVRDLSGLQFRVAGLAGQVFRKLGAAPVQLAAPEIVPTLERGLVDAAEWVGPHDDGRLGFARRALPLPLPLLRPPASASRGGARTSWSTGAPTTSSRTGTGARSRWPAPSRTGRCSAATTT